MERVNALILACLISVSIALIAVLVSPPQKTPKVNTEQQTEYSITDKRQSNPPSVSLKGEPQHENAGEEGTEFWPPLFGYRLKVTDTLIALFTACLFFATWLLYQATKKLVAGADSTAERQLRAYLSVEPGLNARQNQKYKLRFDFRPVVVNNGLTPARDVTILSRAYLCERDVPAGFDFQLVDNVNDPNRSITTISPRQTKTHNSVVTGQFLTRQELRDVWTIRKRFHLYGTVKYVDAFNEPRHTNFSFLISIGNKRASTHWHNTERHNNQT